MGLQNTASLTRPHAPTHLGHGIGVGAVCEEQLARAHLAAHDRIVQGRQASLRGEEEMRRDVHVQVILYPLPSVLLSYSAPLPISPSHLT